NSGGTEAGRGDPVYVFRIEGKNVLYAAFYHHQTGDAPTPPEWKTWAEVAAGAHWLIRMAVHCGANEDWRRNRNALLASQRQHGPRDIWRSMFTRNPADDSLSEAAPARIAPVFDGGFDITYNQSFSFGGVTINRRSLIESMFTSNIP